MISELENNLVVVDLRTKENVLDYIKEYDVDIPQLDDDDYYFRGSMYDFKQETGMSDEEVIDMLFKIEDEDERYIEHTYFTDRGGKRTFKLRLGEVSYFTYEYCYNEPDYPYVIEITRDEYWKILLEKKNSVSNMEKKYFETA